ncbi:MAG: hypothetical protein SVY53_05210 [Chloroflexota bacterium]|nr:hypothetical protein [Chloroflexota bacterium]
MCLDRLSNEARDVGILYGIFEVKNGVIHRLFRDSIPFNADEDGWEHAESINIDGMLDCDCSCDRYKTGFHMYESFKDARDKAVQYALINSTRIIIVTFEWVDMRAQGMTSFPDYASVSVVGDRRPLEIVWDSKHW